MALYVYQLMKAGGGSCWGGNVTVFACIIITALLNRFQIPNNITNKELVIFPKNNVKNVYIQCKKTKISLAGKSQKRILQSMLP